MDNARRTWRPNGIGLAIIGLCLLVGLPFVYIGAGEALDTRRVVERYVAVEGVVVDNRLGVAGDGGQSYYPVVEFTTRDGGRDGARSVRFSDGIGSFPPDYEIGDRVAVLYDPDNPQDARIHSWKRLWFAPALIMGIGALPIVAGLAAAWKFGRAPAG
jgi:hypothetical protein